MDNINKAYVLKGTSKRESKIESMEKKHIFNLTQGTLFRTQFLPLFPFHFC